MDNTRRKINVDEPAWRQWRARAAEQGVTVSELVVSAMTNYLAGGAPAKPAAPAEPAPKPAPVLTNAIADGSGSPQRGVRASAPLEALPDLDGETVVVETASFGSSSPAPKPTHAAKVSGRPLGRR